MNKIQEEILAEFEEKFCNMHGKPRLLRGVFNTLEDAHELLTAFLLQSLQKVENSVREEIKEKIRNATCFDSSIRVLASAKGWCGACGKYWEGGKRAPICDYVRKEDITNRKK